MMKYSSDIITQSVHRCLNSFTPFLLSVLRPTTTRRQGTKLNGWIWMKTPQSRQVQSPTAQLFLHCAARTRYGMVGLGKVWGSCWSCLGQCAPRGHWLKHASANCSTVSTVCALHQPEQASACLNGTRRTTTTKMTMRMRMMRRMMIRMRMRMESSLCRCELAGGLKWFAWKAHSHISIK